MDFRTIDVRHAIIYLECESQEIGKLMCVFEEYRGGPLREKAQPPFPSPVVSAFRSLHLRWFHNETAIRNKLHIW
jgi:hypothetical protein